jgi:hypothetical protein
MMNSLLPLEAVIVLDHVQTLDIHGSIYYQIDYHQEGQTLTQSMRINPEAFYQDPQRGDRVRVTVLMGNIMGAQKL